MLESLQDILLTLVLAGVCTIIACLLRSKKQQILATVTRLIQEAEQSVQGSGMGAEKKAKVVAQLEAAGIKVTAWLDKQIDNIVKYLNEKGGWFANNASDKVKDAFDEVIAGAGGTE